MKQHVPQSKTLLECPVSQKNCEVTFEVNVFRGAQYGGLEATRCSDCSPNTPVETCEQKCIHTQEAQQIHKQTIRQHQDELSAIGPNVIG